MALDNALHPYARETSAADSVVDELMPSDFEWQRLVRRYPLAALGLAALGGYVLGSHRGREILESFANFAAATVSEQVNQLLGKDVV